jgi:hypothetical protein
MMGVLALSDELVAGLLGASLGAVLGGASALAGSIVVERMKLAKNSRIRIFDELLPELVLLVHNLYRFEKHPRDVMDDADKVAKAIARAAILAGRKDRRIGDSLLETWFSFRRAQNAVTVQPMDRDVTDRLLPNWVSVATREDTNRTNELEATLDRQIDEFHRYLSGKI